ncbi:rod shape-determining protein MreC [Bacteroidota bacterium]
MQRFIRRFVLSFKEYFVLVLLLIISLSFLSLNDNAQVKNLKTFTLGYFAFLNYAATGAYRIFSDNDEILELKRQNAELMLQVNLLRDYGLENDELKKLLAYEEKSDIQLVPATIVSKLISKVQGNFVINVGRSDSIKVGMPIINGRGLIGLITDVSDNFSVVRTLHNSRLSLAVIDQRSNVAGILDWDGNHLIMKNIPTTHDVKNGDRIITSEFSTIFPPSIPVGYVTDKETNISGLLNNITVKPFVNLNSLKNILVMKIVQSKQINNLELNLLK